MHKHRVMLKSRKEILGNKPRPNVKIDIKSMFNDCCDDVQVQCDVFIENLTSTVCPPSC